MADSSRIELITIGDELLLGFTVDTNAAFLARALAPVGVEIVRRTTVGDQAPAIAAAVQEALDRTGAVVTTGGLGPTSDDLTKPAIARLFGRGLHLDAETFELLVARWRARGLPETIPTASRQQAMIPDGARILPNRFGSAPGVWLEDEHGRWVVMLPGVPRELRGLVTEQLVPALEARWAARGVQTAAMPVVRSRALRTTGIAEATLAERLGELGAGVDGMSLAYLPSPDGVDLRLTARGLPAAEADRRLAAGIARLRAVVGSWAYGEDGADLAAVVLEQCRARALRLSVGESCTGGMLGARLTAIPGSSAVFVGGVIAYDNVLKGDLLGVSPEDLTVHGAVSEPVARQLAEGACRRTGTALGVGITGIAGPDGGTPDKPVGTVWIALAGVGDTVAQKTVFGGDRDEIRRRAAQSALNLIRRTLAEADASVRP
jgi:nicotinamide-nucleotide amidase